MFFSHNKQEKKKKHTLLFHSVILRRNVVYNIPTFYTWVESKLKQTYKLSFKS